MLMPQLLITLSFLVWWSLVGEAEKMKGFLLYEDQRQEICTSINDCWNALTLKKKIYEKEISMEDFTLCFRINLLSYRGKGLDHHIFRAKTNKFVTNKERNKDWSTGFHFELNPVDGPGNGFITLQTFSDRLQYLLAKYVVYSIWPLYKTEVNANQWNSFCMGTNFRARHIFVARNGYTLHNLSQPQLWADLNLGMDTSALTPFQVRHNKLKNLEDILSFFARLLN